jgi:hypothetical protein
VETRRRASTFSVRSLVAGIYRDSRSANFAPSKPAEFELEVMAVEAQPYTRQRVTFLIEGFRSGPQRKQPAASKEGESRQFGIYYRARRPDKDLSDRIYISVPCIGEDECINSRIGISRGGLLASTSESTLISSLGGREEILNGNHGFPHRTITS